MSSTTSPLGPQPIASAASVPTPYSGKSLGDRVPSPIPILGNCRLEGATCQTPTSFATSPAAAFAKLGLSESASTASSATQQLSSVGSKSNVGRRVTSSTSTKRRLSSTPKRLAIPPHVHFRDSPGSREGSESHSLPASSLLLLSSSAEAAVLESMRFEQGGRASINQTLSPNGNAARASSDTGSPSMHTAALKGSKKPGRLGDLLEKDLGAKKDKGPVFKCEKCSKVYRHPQCLVKHRWEHTAYWAEASKLMLSKHQQVQMLEAAAILATPSGSLPESRSLWPAAVSPSAAGLLGSDHVNLDLIRKGSPSSRRPSPAPSKPTLVVEARDVFDEADDDDDDVMFDMSINGDDSQSMSGASTTETASGKGSGDEKDSGYASGSAKDGVSTVKLSSATSPMPVIDSFASSLSSSTSLLPPSAGIVFSVSAPPPMGYFDTREKASTLAGTSDHLIPPTRPSPGMPNSNSTVMDRYYANLSRKIPSPSMTSTWHSPSYSFTPEYAASHLRSSSTCAEEDDTQMTRSKCLDGSLIPQHRRESPHRANDDDDGDDDDDDDYDDDVASSQLHQNWNRGHVVDVDEVANMEL